MANKSPYLGQAIFIVSFKIDNEIRFKLGDIERTFQSVAPGQVIGTNVADSAPPSIPRFTLQSGSKRISVSQLFVQLEMDFMEQRKEIPAVMEIIKKNVLLFWDGASRLKTFNEMTDVGMVLVINIPREEAGAEIAEKIFNRFAKFPKLGEIANSSIRFGFLNSTKCCYINVEVGHYELRVGKITAQPGQPQHLDVDSLPVQETGFEIKLDVNSKPLRQAGVEVTEDLARVIIAELTSLLKFQGPELLVW